MKKALYLFFLFILLFQNGYSIELSLEENKAESGTIGYVDIEKIFKKYPLTKITREKVDKQIKEKQKILDEKQEEINNVKTNIIKLKQEREFALSMQKMIEQTNKFIVENKVSSSSVAVATSAYVAPSTFSAIIADSNLINSTFTNVNSTALIMNSTSTVISSTAAVISSTVSIINPATTLINPTTSYSSSISTSSASKIIISTITEFENLKTTDSVSAQSSSIIKFSTNTSGEKQGILNLPGIGALPLNNYKFSVSTSPQEIDLKIKENEEKLDNLEKEYLKMKRGYEDEIFKIQDEETEKILGRIYIKLKELAIKEGVSVVVDKKSILFGHKAVDLTNKLLQDMEEEYEP
jgi:Skp family chaperone for outer membrane proteins